MPAASAICCNELRRPDVAMTEFAVCEDLGAPGGFLADGWSLAAMSLRREPLRPGEAGHLSHRLLSR